MRIKDITDAIEAFAPLCAQEDFDNSGLLVGHFEQEVESALLCVDITEEVMDEAERLGIGMVVSHHPVIFHPLRKLTGANYVERIVERAVRGGIALYASHTNLDAVAGGMSWALAAMLGIGSPRVLSNIKPANPDVGFGVVGELAEAAPAEKFMRHVMDVLKVKVIRHSDICRPKVKRVAICSGSGASLIEAAAAAGADIYIAADFKYNSFLDADKRLIVADVGHFESEYCAIDLLYDVITKKIPTFAIRKSENSRNPVNYLV